MIADAPTIAPWRLANIWQDRDRCAARAADTTRSLTGRHMSEDILDGIDSTLLTLGVIDRFEAGPELVEVRS